jgi:mevalonate kinase
VSLRFPDIGLDHTWDIDDLPWDIFQAEGKKKTYYDTVTQLDPELSEAILPFIAQVAPDSDTSISDHNRRILRSSATCFLYLFLSLSSPTQHAACVYTVRSTIPVSAGLGSSATISVCLATALLHQVHALSGPHRDQPKEEAGLQVARINAWAFVGELAIHGNPSGVDNTVASYGKAAFYRRTDYNRPPEVRFLPNFPELPLLVVNSKQPRSTAVEVAKVAHQRETFPDVTNAILDGVDKVTMEALKLLEGDGPATDDPSVLRKLGQLAAINHGLLSSLGVSHAKLEQIRGLVDTAGLGWTKLTGAGGGGCAITFLNQDVDSTQDSDSSASSGGSSSALDDLLEELEEAGFDPFTTKLAGDGVGVLYPAVLDNASGEAGGEDIDQEKFLRADGIEGIERLVGVAASHPTGKNKRSREGWRFWRT